MRKVIFANDQIYHVLNRGIEHRPIFTSEREYARAKQTLDFYRFENPPLKLSRALTLRTDEKELFFRDLRNRKKIIEIISYCFMPNHFHFLLKQKLEDGISQCLSNFSNSYVRYFNTKHGRSGPLFQGPFKAVRMEADEQLIHVSRYIHLNPVVSYLVKRKELDVYPWSSLPEFLGIRNEGISNKEIILGHFSSAEQYRKFVHDQIDYARNLELIKHLALE